MSCNVVSQEKLQKPSIRWLGVWKCLEIELHTQSNWSNKRNVATKKFTIHSNFQAPDSEMRKFGRCNLIESTNSTKIPKKVNSEWIKDCSLVMNMKFRMKIGTKDPIAKLKTWTKWKSREKSNRRLKTMNNVWSFRVYVSLLWLKDYQSSIVYSIINLRFC